jgi:hypothetical protein
MQRMFKTFLSIFILVISLSFASTALVKAQDEKDTEIHKLQTNIKLFDEAINELEACTPMEAALVYAKGVRNRNGAMQYAVFSNKLKEEFRQKIGGGIWVTGVSSPWVSDYEIVSEKKNNNAYKIILKFNWATSTGPAGSTKEELTIAKENGKWRIMNIRQLNQ